MKLASILAETWINFKFFGVRKYYALSRRFPKFAWRLKKLALPLVRKADACYARYKTNHPD